MSSIRKRLLATAALPLFAASLGLNGLAAANPSDEPFVLAQAEAPAPGEVPPEELPVEEAPVEEPPADQPPVEQPPVEEPPAEEPPAEETPVEEPPAPEEGATEAPAPDAPAEAPPAPEAVEEAPAEEQTAPAEEPAMQEAPAAEEAPAEEAPAPDEPPVEPQAEEAPAEEPAASEPAPEMDAQPEEEAPAAEPDAAPETMESAPADESPAPEAADDTAPAAEEAPAPEEVPLPEEAPARDAAPDGGADAETQAAPEGQTDEPAPADDGAAEPEPDASESQDQPADAPTEPAARQSDEQPQPDAEAADPAPADEQDGSRVRGEATTESEAEAAPAEEVEMLSVEDGAPVLDSAKENQRRANTRRENGEAAAAPEEPVTLEQARPDADPQEIEALRERIEQLESRRDRRPESDDDARSLLLGAAAGAVAGAVVPSIVDFARGDRLQSAPVYDAPDTVTVIDERDGNRRLVRIDDRTVVRHSDRDRLARDAQDVYYESLPGGRTREVVVRRNGAEVITVRNRYGDIIQRSRIRPNGDEVVLFYAPEYDREERYVYRDPGRYLPPLRLTVPVDEYIYDSTRADGYEDYVTFFEQPPIEPLIETYSIEEVKQSSRVRDIMPRVDLDNITFEFGSASIGDDQVGSLEDMANGMAAMLEEDESEIFLLEGHTDAVGTDEANLVLSDERAESVAIALTNVFGIPPENLQTQGYGEQYLKVDTDEPERLNRRVTIRRITPLVQSAEAQ